MKLAAVVVFYFPSEKNIKNINNYIDVVDKVIVVDNSDDEIERMKNTEKIEYIKLGENKGIAYALNVGAKRAIEDKKVIDILSEDSNGNRNSAIHPYQTLDDFIEKNLRDYTITHMSPDVETVNIGESLYKKLKKKKLI